MKRILFSFIFLLIFISLVGLVSARCSETPQDNDYFAYIEECDNDNVYYNTYYINNQLSLHLNLPYQKIQKISSKLGFDNLPVVFDENGVVSKCQVKREGSRNTISGREVDVFVVYCGFRLDDVSRRYIQFNDKDVQGIGYSLRRFEQFLIEDDADFNIQKSIELHRDGRPYKGDIVYAYDDDNLKWVGGIIEDSFDYPERYQLAGAEIVFYGKEKRFLSPAYSFSDIKFNDKSSYYRRERNNGIKTYVIKEVPVIVRYNRYKHELSQREGSLIDEYGQEIKGLNFFFIKDEQILYCCLDEEEPSLENCVIEQEPKQYSFSLKNAPKCDFSVGNMISQAEEKRIKTNNVELIYPPDLQGALLKIKA